LLLDVLAISFVFLHPERFPELIGLVHATSINLTRRGRKWKGAEAFFEFSGTFSRSHALYW